MLHEMLIAVILCLRRWDGVTEWLRLCTWHCEVVGLNPGWGSNPLSPSPRLQSALYSGISVPKQYGIGNAREHALTFQNSLLLFLRN